MVKPVRFGPTPGESLSVPSVRCARRSRTARRGSPGGAVSPLLLLRPAPPSSPRRPRETAVVSGCQPGYGKARLQFVRLSARVSSRRLDTKRCLCSSHTVTNTAVSVGTGDGLLAGESRGTTVPVPARSASCSGWATSRGRSRIHRARIPPADPGVPRRRDAAPGRVPADVETGGSLRGVYEYDRSRTSDPLSSWSRWYRRRCSRRPGRTPRRVPSPNPPTSRCRE